MWYLYSVLVWILPEADPEIKIYLQVVYSRSTEWVELNPLGVAGEKSKTQTSELF